jgi:Secretion system C-terminal sorting domain
MKIILFILLIFGTKLFSSDWKLVTTEPYAIREITCLDSNLCFALAGAPRGPQLFKSTDQGMTWEMIYSTDIFIDGSLINANELEVIDENNIYITFTDNKAIIQKSTDGGYTFEDITLLEGYHRYGQFRMYDLLIGYVLIGFDAFVTFDGWETSIKLEDPMFQDNYIRPVFLDSNNILILPISLDGDRLVKYNIRTNEYEVLFTFESEVSAYSTYIDKLEYVNDELAFLVGGKRINVGSQYRDIIYKTDGSLYNWKKVVDEEVTPKFGLNDISFYDEYNGVATGNGGKILITKDKGETWEYEIPKEELYIGKDTIYGPNYMEIEWIGKTPFFGTRNGGNIFKYEGDFFDFSHPIQLEKPEISSDECELYNLSDDDYLEWESVDEVKFYAIEIAEDYNFNKIEHEKTSIKATSYQLPNLEPGLKYYWRVKSLGLNAESKWSSSCSFTTQLDVVDGLYPDCEDTSYVKNILLRWDKSKNASNYIIEVSSSNTFGSFIVQDTIQTTQYNLIELDSNKTFFWRVKSFNDLSESAWSEVCNLTYKILDSVEDEKKLSSITIFPNPVGDFLSLSIEKLDINNRDYQIYDINGKIILEGELSPMNKSFSIDISSLVGGTYILNVGKLKAKFIKE